VVGREPLGVGGDQDARTDAVGRAEHAETVREAERRSADDERATRVAEAAEREHKP
jgi:hypothetical protein